MESIPRGTLNIGKKRGVKMADALIEWLHMMYNKATALRVLNALIGRLNDRKKDFE